MDWCSKENVNTGAAWLSSARVVENSTPTGKASLHLEKAGKADLRNAHSTVGPHSHLMRGTGNTNLARMIKHSADPRRRLHASFVMPGFARDNTMSDSVEIASDIQLLARMDPQIPLVDPMPHKGFASPRNEEPGRDRPRPPPPPGPHDPHPPPPPGPHDPHPPPPPGPHDPHPPHPPVPPHNHDSDSDSDDEDGDEDDASPKKHHQHHPHHSDEPREERHQLEDSYFAGSLGFGASGDYCLYENVQDLSPPCAQAIGNVYALREQYWTSYNEAQEAGHHHHPVFGLFIIGFFLVILLKKIMHAPRRRQVHKFLTALNEQPELKAQLESQLNMDIPKPRTRTCCGGERRSCLRRLFFALGYIVFAFVASVFIAVTSLEMTAGIVDGMESGAPEDAPPASPFFVLSILMLIVVGQLILLRVAMRTVGRLWHNHCGATIEDNAGQFNDGGSSSPTANNGTGGNGLQVEFQRLASLPVSFYREYVSPRVSSLFTTRAAVSEGYAPLRSGEDEREMIAVGRHVTPSSHGQPTQYAVYTGVPINPSNVVHITARPVSSVNLV